MLILQNYLLISFISGISLKTTCLSYSQPYLFRPIAFTYRSGIYFWNFASLCGILSITIFIIYGISLGFIGVITGIILFVLGYSLGLWTTKFGLISPVCNILLAITALRLLSDIFYKVKWR